MRLLTLCILALISCAFPAQAAEPTWTSTGRSYWLQAWDGKSDPSTVPQFTEVGECKYVLRNQHCYKGMEFTVKAESSDLQPTWYNAVLSPLTPGNVSYGKQRVEFDPSVNWIIQEDGVYDFILQELYSSASQTSFSPIYIVAQKHGQNSRLSASTFVSADNEADDAPKSFLLAEPALGNIYHHFEDNTSKTVYVTDADGKSYGFKADDTNSLSGKAFLKPNTLVDMAIKGADADYAAFAGPDNYSLYLFDTSAKKALLYNLTPSSYTSDGTKFYVIGRDAYSTDDTWPYKLEMGIDQHNFPTRLNALVDAYVEDTGSGSLTHYVPENFEFYIKAEKNDNGTITELTEPGLDLRPATGSADGEIITKEVPARLLPETFGGQGTFKIKTGSRPFLICLDPASLTVRGYKPDGNPWRIAEVPYDNLYLVGDMKLIDENGDKVRINKWTTCDERLKLNFDNYIYGKTAEIELKVYDDSYFRISTPDDAVKGYWGYTLADGQKCIVNTRGNWSPQTSNDIDVPLGDSDNYAASTWFQGKPGEGPRFHLPKGEYILRVHYMEDYGDPNCLQVYALPQVETDTYYLAVKDNRTNQTSTYRLTGDGKHLSCRFKTEYPSYAESRDEITSQMFVYRFTPTGDRYFIAPNSSIYPNANEEFSLLMSSPYVNSCNTFTFSSYDGYHEFQLDLSDTDNIKGKIIEANEADMPLKPEDFKDAQGNPVTHYFFVGSRTGDFRLLPEWELKRENGFKIENRLMYPGMFGIAKVDSYDDYIHHRFEFYTIIDQPGQGKVVNAADTYMVGQDPYSPVDWETNTKMKATAIKEYGHYNIAANTHTYTEWPYYVISTKYVDSYSPLFAASWWHFCEFPTDVTDESNHNTNKNLSEAFKKGTPSLATFHISLEQNGNPNGAPVEFVIDNVTTWQQNKEAVLNEVNFMLCGTNITNESRNADGTQLIDPARNPINYYSNVPDWANQWIQYDQETGRPYMDAYGKYLPMTVYQDSWMKDHPVLFYRESDNYRYTSNDLILKPLKEIESQEIPDKFLQYYKEMQTRTLGDGTNKKHAEPDAALKYDFYDRVGEPDADTYMKFRNGDIPAPDGGWQPYVLSDLSFGGMFKVWSGYGGGHAGYGAWRDDIVPGDAYAWFNLNVGHYKARNPMRVDSQELERNASASDETPYPDEKKVDFYITGKDDPAADFMTIPDEDGVFVNKDIKRLILWLNTDDRTDPSDNRTSGMAKSYVQLVVSDLSPVIRAYFGEAPRSIRYAWHLVSDNVIEDKRIEKAVVSVYRNNQLIDSFEQTDAAGRMASECTREDMFTGQLNDQLPGDYWFRVDVTYTDSNKDAVSNHLTLFPTMVPVDITVAQTTGTVKINGNTTYGFSINGSAGLSYENGNKEFIAYTDNGGDTQWLYLKDVIAGFEISANGEPLPDDDTDADNGNVAYTPGEASTFRFPLTGETTVTFSARPVLKTGILVPGDQTADGQPVQISREILDNLSVTPSTAVVDVVVPTPSGSISAPTVITETLDDYLNYPATADRHPGHHDIAPVYYHTVNNINVDLSWVNNVYLEGEGDQAETVTYSVTGNTGVGSDITRSPADAPETANLIHTNMQYVGGGFSSTSNSTTIWVDKNFVMTAIYSRGGREIYRSTGIPYGNPYISPKGPDFKYTVQSAYIQPVVSDIFDDADGNQHQVYDMRINLGSLLSYSASSSQKMARFGGFEVTGDAYSQCAHTDAADYGSHVQPVPYISAKTSWAGTTWYGLAEPYEEWFTSRKNGATLWSKETNDWSSRIVNETFGINFPHVGCTTPDNRLSETKAFNMNLSLIYPFLVKTPVAQSASTVSTMARTADEPAYATSIGIHKLWKTLAVPSLTLPENVVTGIENVEADSDADNTRRDVCTPAGVVILRDVTLKEATRTLAPGVYLFGSEKIVIK